MDVDAEITANDLTAIQQRVAAARQANHTVYGWAEVLDVENLLTYISYLRSRVTSLEMDRVAWEREARQQAFLAEQRTGEITRLNATIDALRRGTSGFAPGGPGPHQHP